MTDTVLGAIIGVGGTIFGVILAGPLTYHFSKVLVKKTHENALDVMRRQEFHSAASKFRANIIYELSDLYPIEQYWDKKTSLDSINPFPESTVLQLSSGTLSLAKQTLILP